MGGSCSPDTHYLYSSSPSNIGEISLIETTSRVNPQSTPRVFCHLAISEPIEDCFKFPVIEIYNSNVINSLMKKFQMKVL